MSIDEAIRHAEECAESCDRLADLCVEDTSRNRNHRCAEEHRQLAEWLKELKAYRQTDCPWK